MVRTAKLLLVKPVAFAPCVLLARVCARGERGIKWPGIPQYRMLFVCGGLSQDFDSLLWAWPVCVQKSLKKSFIKKFVLPKPCYSIIELTCAV